MLEDMLGIRQDYTLPTDGSYLKAAWSDGDELECIKWAECYTNLAGGKALASVTAGHSALVGECVIGHYTYGKGKVILCGTIPNEEGLKKLVDIALEDSGVKTYGISGDVVVIPREGNGQRGIIICEIANEKGSIVLDKTMTDILTGKEYPAGRADIEPYGIYVFAE